MQKILLFFISIFYFSLAFTQVQTGKASYYADKFEGRATANGEKYKHNKLTAAHKTLPFGTVVNVTNKANNKSVEVRINDRGPYVDDRIIDLSLSAAEKLDFINQGLADVEIEVIDPGDGKGSVVPVQIDNVRVEENELYEFDVSKVRASGFGVQIGSYRELVNLIKFSENLKSSYRKQVTVQVKVVNGVKVYSIILGQFPNRKKAENFKADLIKKYPGAFIVDFSKIKS